MCVCVCGVCAVLCRVPRVKVVVVEVGAGDKITTVRHASESFMRDVTEVGTLLPHHTTTFS